MYITESELQSKSWTLSGNDVVSIGPLNTPPWCGMGIVAMHLYEKSLYFLLTFAVNVTLL